MNFLTGLTALAILLGTTTANALAHSKASKKNYHTDSFWSGEYPGPVIKVTKNVQVDATAEIPNPNLAAPQKLSCTIPSGVYHPWATKTTATYHSVTGIRDYKAKKATVVALDQPSRVINIDIKKGEIVHQLAYFGEGYCLLEAKSLRGSANCPDEDTYKAINRNDYYRQFFQVQCTEGHSAYVAASEDIFKIEGIVPGNITDYGHVEE